MLNVKVFAIDTYLMRASYPNIINISPNPAGESHTKLQILKWLSQLDGAHANCIHLI